MRDGAKTRFANLTEFYTRCLDDAVLDITTGAFDYNTVLKRTVRMITESGIRKIEYDTMNKQYSSARVEVAARRAVMTGVKQVTAKINEQTAEILDTDMYEVTAHTGCRENHLPWQGKWYSMSDLRRVCGYGRVDGLCGANCGHDFHQVIPGVDRPAYTKDELEAIQKSEKSKTEYGGKKFTPYEATQHQRSLERKMRAFRQKIKLLEDGGAKDEDVIAARANYRAISGEYTRFSKAFNLPQQRERVLIDGLGNIGSGKYKIKS